MTLYLKKNLRTGSLGNRVCKSFLFSTPWRIGPSILGRLVLSRAGLCSKFRALQIEEYLRNGSNSGARNRTLFHIALLCCWHDVLKKYANRLIARDVADGHTEAEARKILRSAWKRFQQNGSRRFSASDGSEPSPSPSAGSSGITLPVPIANGFITFLETAFEPDEFVALSEAVWNGKDKFELRKRETRKRDQWINDCRNGTLPKSFLLVSSLLSDYTKTSDALRKYEPALQLEQCDLNQMIARREAEQGAQARHLRLSVVRWMSSCIPDMMACKDNAAAKVYFAHSFHDVLIQTVRASEAAKIPVPQWCIDAIKDEWRTGELEAKL